MLIVHLLGLVMGLGTSFALSTMHHLGITMLIISGLYLMSPFWMTLNARPLLITKLILVLVLQFASYCSVSIPIGQRTETQSQI